MFIADNLLTAQDIEALNNYPKDWKYGWVGSPGSTERYYNSAIQDLGGANRRTVTVDQRLAAIVEKLKEAPSDRLIRSYFNKTIHGIEPAAHRDTPIRHGSDYTVVVYLVPRWQLTWGGETLVYEEDGTVQAATVKPGRAIKFPSGKLHQAKGLTAICPVERIVAVFKYAKASGVESFILSKDWDKLPHKMGYTSNFAEHLLETAGILASVGAARHVIAAGALHAAYGTEFFTPPNPPTREEIRALVGDAAEQLVYAFCNTPRAEVKANGSKELKMLAWANEYNLKKLREVMA
jgi:hypothetical protein